MDSVRFGRALGIGTRLAAKTLAEAVDAAMSPNPSAKSETAAPATRTPAAGIPATRTPDNRTEAVRAQAGQQVRRTTAQVKQGGRGLKEGSRRFRETVAEPFVRLSGVLWLEVTGVFFGIFALSSGIAMWKERMHFHPASGDHDSHMHLLLLGGMTLVFGYFFISSFVKAHLRGKKR